MANTESTEEEMRRALFGSPEAPAPVNVNVTVTVTVTASVTSPTVVIGPPASSKLRKAARTFIPKLKVTLRVGNEFEGATELFVYDADTLSKLQAELDATKAARKKFKYIELVSIESA